MKIFSFSDLNGKIENLDIFEDEGLLDVDIILFSGGFLSSFANLQMQDQYLIILLMYLAP
jgi:hypothetical protein